MQMSRVQRMQISVAIWSLFLQGLTKVLGGRRPLLYSYQSSLPKLPVPALRDTMKRVSDVTKQIRCVTQSR